MATDLLLGGVAILICFYQAYRLGNDEKILVQHKRLIARILKQNEALRTQVGELQQIIDAITVPVEESPSDEDESSQPEEAAGQVRPPSLASLKGDTSDHG